MPRLIPLPAATLLAALTSPLAFAQDVEVPLRNWTVPPYTLSSAGPGMTTMTDVSPPRVFVGVAPCRIADTRGNGFTGQAGPPQLTIAARVFQITGTVPGLPTQCGIPAGAESVSFQFTIVFPNSAGNLIAWPGGTAPTISVLNWSAGETALGNGTIVPLSGSGSLSVQINAAVPSATGHLVIDVNGYFADTLDTPTNFLLLINNNPGGATGAFGNLSDAGGSSGVLGTAGPGFARPTFLNAGVRGESLLTGMRGVSRLQGVAGSVVNTGGSELAFGILGFDVNIADPAINGQDVGVFGYTGSNAAQAGAVIGYAVAASGATAGVRGVIGSGSAGAAGVRGQDGGGPVPLLWPGSNQSAGVRGESHGGLGILGLSDDYCGARGVNTGGTAATLGCTGGDGAVVQGNLQVFGGAKNFLEPHPRDASKLIRYTSLEGNESGTYFRGRAKFQDGVAIIEVPEDFRIVTAEEGLSIQVTPIGEMATVAVQSIGLDRIVVRGSRSVEFFYTVNGIRRAYKDQPVMIENKPMLIPQSPDDRIPEYLPQVLRDRLISNGTYNADGTVNMETARRLGWDRIWEERSRPRPQPAEP